MSMRGLVVALLCGMLGLGLGALVAYAARPATSRAGTADPITAVSPSVPIDARTQPSYAPDIAYPTLSRDLPLPPPDHTIGNDLATWTYHVPAGWQAYAVCRYAGECQPPIADDSPITPPQAARASEVRFRPPDEPSVGGYSLRVQALDNTNFNPEQVVATKIVGFRQQFTGQHFSVLHRTTSAVYFTYTYGSPGQLRLRYNFFQWFQVPGQSSATLEMSVAGRQRDVPGLKALFNRFADNVVGTSTPYHPPRANAHRQAQAQTQPPSQGG
jgi:hypothetical protein